MTPMMPSPAPSKTPVPVRPLLDPIKAPMQPHPTIQTMKMTIVQLSTLTPDTPLGGEDGILGRQHRERLSFLDLEIAGS